MGYDQLIRAAGDAIGEGKEDDYVIAPTKHADQLAEQAPALAKILRRSEISTVARLYEEKDAEARQAQAVFKRMARRANWAVLLTACFSTLLLMTVPLAVLSKGWLQMLLGICGIVAGGLGSMWLFRVRDGNLLERWMTARAGAETRRIEYFELSTSMKDDCEGGYIPLPLLQLEYFRRYQLEVQKVYYRRRGAEHERSADKILTLSSIAVAVAAIATGIGGWWSGQLVWMAGIGVFATSLGSFASAKEAVNQDRRNTERYRRTREALEGLSARLDDVRDTAAQGEREPLQKFVAAVNEQLSLEHRQWLETSESTAASLAKLENALTKLKAKPDAGTTDPGQPPSGVHP